MSIYDKIKIYLKDNHYLNFDQTRQISDWISFVYNFNNNKANCVYNTQSNELEVYIHSNYGR